MYAEDFSANENRLKVNQAEAKEFITTLGYKSPNEIFMRSFFPNDDSRSSTDKGRKADKLDFNLVEQWQKERRGVYLVVNGGGHKDEEVRCGRAVFCEHDKICKADQLVLWKILGLPQPTIQIDTGGKSIHSYWVFEEPITIQQWKGLQSDLLVFSDGDRAIKNPSRVMRLPGAWHISQKGAVQTKIVTNCGQKYTFEQLRDVIPVHKKEQKVSKPKAKAQTATSQPKRGASLIEWARFYLSFLGESVSDDREKWIHVGMVLKSIDESLYHDYENFSMLSNQYTPEATLKAWNSFKSSGLNIGTLGKLAKENGWIPKKRTTDENSSVRNIVQLPLQDVTGGLKERIQRFLDSNPTADLIESEKINIRIENPHILSAEIEKLFNLAIKKNDETESRSDLQKELDELQNLGEQSLQLSDYLPESLANAIKSWNQWLNIRPEVILTAVLGTSSSLHTVGTRIYLCREENFWVTSNMFTAIIADSGQKKSPIFRTFAKEPLMQLKREADEFYKEQFRDFEEATEKWAADKMAAYEKGDKFYEPEPKPPNKPAPFYFNNATGEGIGKAASINPEKTLFLLVDELSGYFNSQNLYRGGRGSDKQEALSYHDGEGKTTLRAGGIQMDVPQIYQSIFGTIQPTIIKKIMGNCDDADGSWARFFFAQQPLALSSLPEKDTGRFSLTERLAAVYRNIFYLPLTEYELTPEAYDVYRPFYDSLEKMRMLTPKAGMRALYGKAEGHTGILALNLHVLEAAVAGIKPQKQISAEIMEKAIALMKFYIGQTKLLYNQFEDDLAPRLQKIINLSKTNKEMGGDGWIKVKQVQLATTAKNRGKAEVVKTDFRELEAMRRGSTRTVGKALEFNYLIFSTIESSRGSRLVDAPTTVESTDNKGVEVLGSQSSRVSPFVEPFFEEEEEVEEDIKISKPTTLTTLPCNVDPVNVSAVDDPTTSRLPATTSEKDLTVTPTATLNEVVPPTTVESLEPGMRVRYFCKGSKNDGRKGTIQKIRPIRDGRKVVCSREDGSVICEAVIKIDTDGTLAPELATCPIPGTPKHYLEVMSR